MSLEPIKEITLLRDDATRCIKIISTLINLASKRSAQGNAEEAGRRVLLLCGPNGDSGFIGTILRRMPRVQHLLDFPETKIVFGTGATGSHELIAAVAERMLVELACAGGETPEGAVKNWPQVRQRLLKFKSEIDEKVDVDLAKLIALVSQEAALGIAAYQAWLANVHQPEPEYSIAMSPAQAGKAFGISAKLFVRMVEKGRIRVKQLTLKAYQVDLRDLPKTKRS